MQIAISTMHLMPNNLAIPNNLLPFLIFASLRTICSKGDCAFRKGTAVLRIRHLGRMADTAPLNQRATKASALPIRAKLSGDPGGLSPKIRDFRGLHKGKAMRSDEDSLRRLVRDNDNVNDNDNKLPTPKLLVS